MTGSSTLRDQMAFVPQMLVGALTRDPDRSVITMPDGTVLSAAGIAAITSCYKQAIDGLAMPGRSVIALLSNNRAEVLHATHALMLTDHVLVPLHPRGSLEDHLYVMGDAGVDAVIFEPAYASRIEEMRSYCGEGVRWLSMGQCEGAVDIVAAAEALKPQPLSAPQVSGADICRLSYSGGTTGRPKAILGTHESMRFMLQIVMAEWEWPRELRHLVCAPLSHSGMAAVMPVLLRGGSLHVLNGFDPLEVLETIERERITSILLVPTMIYALLDHPRFSQFNLSSLQTVFYGASAMSPARLKEGIEKLGPVFFQFYGQAEAPMTVMVMRRDEHLVHDMDRLAGCGRPVPWITMALLDDRLEPVPDGEPGEICVRGPLVMEGYHNQPEQTAQAFAGDWLHTGDVAVRDGNGFYRIIDRKKDMIVTGGYNVYAREVEDVIGTHPAVAQCAVIGVADERWGEAVKACVRLRDGASECADEIIALVRERKGGVQAPKSVDFVDDIPMTAVGKPDKKALRARYIAAAKLACP